MVAEGGFQYTVEDGVSGRLLPRGDWPAWHQALQEASEPSNRKSWAKQGQENIEQMGLTPKNQATRLVDILGFSEDE